MKYLPKTFIIEAAILFMIAAVSGFVVNIFHPHNVNFTSQRPPVEYAQDSLFAVELPDASIMTDEQAQSERNREPLIISTQKMIELVKTRQGILIDARNKQAHSKKSIQPSVNLPFADMDAYDATIPILPKNKWLICYCDGPQCELAESLAWDLITFGFERVAVYRAGMVGGKKFGYSIGEN